VADRASNPAFPLRQAVALGLLQGPTELLPVSSSAHTTLLPWLAGWRYSQLEAEVRKSFEVALHAGAGLALAFEMRGELLEDAATLDRRRAAVVACSAGPPAVAGYAFRRLIERRMGGPSSIAAGLIVGAAAMALADVAPGRGARSVGDAGPRDGLALGLAQALALIPGISRNGATLTAARALGFTRAGAETLSWHAALPVILGAGALELRGLARRGTRQGVAAMAAGGASAFASTLLSSRALAHTPRGRALLPFSLYRGALAVVVIRRLRYAHNRGG
jgi:undecaprenyl-diphosphatase